METANPTRYERTFSDVCVTINDGKPFYTSCVYCGKLGTVSVTLKRCSRCQAAAYCGKDCQKEDYKTHQLWCKRIYITQKATEEEMNRLRDSGDTIRSFIDGFQSQGLGIPGILNPPEEWQQVFTYCVIRARLSGALVRESYERLDQGGRLNELALELGLEHTLDLMMVDESDRSGASNSIGAYMITLGKYQQAYDILKFYMNTAIQSQIVEKPAFLQLRGENMFEPLETAGLNTVGGASKCLDMALLKVYLFSTVRSAQLFAKVFDDNQDIATVIGSFLNAPKGWNEVNAGSLLYQAQQLLSCVHAMNAHIIPGFLNPDPLLEMGLYSDDPNNLDVEGSVYEASLIMKQILPWWKHNKIAMKFVSNFARGLPHSVVGTAMVRRVS